MIQLRIVRLSLISITALVFSCNNKNVAGQFSVKGILKNAPNQQIYLEELYFSQKEPLLLDTAEIKNGSFLLTGIAAEQGLYRLRLEKSPAPFFFINDVPDISFSADLNNTSLEKQLFNTPANRSLQKFMSGVNGYRKTMEEKATSLQQYANPLNTDSVYQVMKNGYSKAENSYKNYILGSLDTVTNPVVALFILGYTRSIEPDQLEKTVSGLTKRFPTNAAIATIVGQYNQMISQYKAKPHDGGLAPDISMPDTSGKIFTLSSLRGKYVLVDFWASWCGPCRGENPNVVSAYNSFKDKNFTVLGVSLDKEKAAWVKAIADDQLSWYHISDLKYWSSAAVSLYGFDGIPYNVLVNPEGKIIATNLRGTNLPAKLAEVLNK